MAIEYSPLTFLQSHDSAKPHPQAATTGLVILNTPIPSNNLLSTLWANSSFHVCADGGANRLHDFSSHSRENYIPDEITGDLDSVRPEVRDYYTSHGTSVVRDPDQYSTDFNKSVSRCIAHDVKDILITGSLGGRVDHGLGLISELGKEVARRQGVRLWFFTERSVSFVLPVGEAKVEVPKGGGKVTENVGIVPVFGAARITLKGFEWDVEDWETYMGGQVSTSNHLRKDVVEVKTDTPVLFTVELQV